MNEVIYHITKCEKNKFWANLNLFEGHFGFCSGCKTKMGSF